MTAGSVPGPRVLETTYWRRCAYGLVIPASRAARRAVGTVSGYGPVVQAVQAALCRSSPPGEEVVLAVGAGDAAVEGDSDVVQSFRIVQHVREPAAGEAGAGRVRPWGTFQLVEGTAEVRQPVHPVGVRPLPTTRPPPPCRLPCVRGGR
ncbi:hypothetical protein GCM10010129_79100 [Streptomyces fumigatiscleroticus]|nr:hypothetical protein GCM10010129_79100 [Streptomyces fumigatiscleroticus]